MGRVGVTASDEFATLFWEGTDGKASGENEPIADEWAAMLVAGKAMENMTPAAKPRVKDFKNFMVWSPYFCWHTQFWKKPPNVGVSRLRGSSRDG
jgi:hypothetical protein